MAIPVAADTPPAPTLHAPLAEGGVGLSTRAVGDDGGVLGVMAATAIGNSVAVGTGTVGVAGVRVAVGVFETTVGSGVVVATSAVGVAVGGTDVAVGVGVGVGTGVSVGGTGVAEGVAVGEAVGVGSASICTNAETMAVPPFDVISILPESVPAGAVSEITKTTLPGPVPPSRPSTRIQSGWLDTSHFRSPNSAVFVSATVSTGPSPCIIVPKSSAAGWT